MKDKYIHHFLILLVMFLLTSCSIPKSIKQINLINKNITTIQQEVKEVKNTIKKTKRSIIKIKKEQPLCNLTEIDDRIEILDITANSIENNLFTVKQQIEVNRDIIKAEIKEYKSKYLKCIFYIIGLFLLLLLIIFDKIKTNIVNITNYTKNIYNWFKKR